MVQELLAFSLTSPAHRDIALPKLATLILVRRGQAAAFDGEAWHPARPGDAIFLRSAEGVRITGATGEAVAWSFPAEASQHDSFVLPAARLVADARCHTLATLLSQEDRATAVTDHLLQAFLLCARELRGLQPVEPGCRDEQIRRAIALVGSDLSRRWSVSALSKAVGLSRSAFARRFRAALATPPERYFTELRLTQAAQRLVFSDESLAAVAGAIGYRSPFAFNRAFKRHHGIAPGAYRQQWRPVVPSARDRVCMVA